jgi:hypothetical protein
MVSLPGDPKKRAEIAASLSSTLPTLSSPPILWQGDFNTMVIGGSAL